MFLSEVLGKYKDCTLKSVFVSGVLGISKDSGSLSTFNPCLFQEFSIYLKILAAYLQPNVTFVHSNPCFFQEFSVYLKILAAYLHVYI